MYVNFFLLIEVDPLAIGAQHDVSAEPCLVPLAKVELQLVMSDLAVLIKGRRDRSKYPTQ
jgi:hypothetical protein